VATVVLPAIDGRILKIRKASTPDDVHQEIYHVTSRATFVEVLAAPG
jgi:hypothetical protein